MTYNRSLFGDKVKELRKKQKLTQERVAELIEVHVDTIKRLESRSKLPSVNILERLSPVLKHDILDLLSKCRLDDFPQYEDIQNRLETKFSSNDFLTLDVELGELEALLPTVKNIFFAEQIEQLALLTKGVLLYKKEKKSDLALNTFVNALKVTARDFSLSKYKDFYYNSMEIRILMNIGFVYHQQDNLDEYIDIMEFCIDKVDENSAMYPKLCHNLAGTYHRTKNYEKALEYSNLGIDSCYNIKYYNLLYFLYFGKGTAEYRLGDKNHMQSFRKAIDLCEIFQEYQLRDSMIKDCYEYFGIDLSRKHR